MDMPTTDVQPSVHARLRASLRNLGLIGTLIALATLFSLLSPYFLTFGNISNLLLAVSVIGTMAAVSTLVIIGRSLDLSVGSIAALTGVVAAIAVEQYKLPWAAGIAVGLGAGALCGAFNGLMVSWLRINPIIATIGTLSLFRGAAFILTDGQTVLVESEAILFFGAGRLLGVPVSVWVFALVVALAHAFAERTSPGRAVFALGASPRAALVAGIRISHYRFWLLVASGMSAGLAGVMLIGQAGTAIPSAAGAYELLVITAVLLGGTSLAGGQGSVMRTLLGVLIIGVLNNGMILLAVPSFYQISANGVLLLIAVAIDQLKHRKDTEIE